MAVALGKMKIDWLSTDEYYDVSMDSYQSLYHTHLYASLRPDQKIILVPFAAYCEEKCPVGQNLSAADSVCSGKARDHIGWFQADEKVIGFSIYRMKAMWGAIEGKDICLNPGGTGLGLVDKCANGELAMPDTYALYTKLNHPNLGSATSSEDNTAT